MIRLVCGAREFDSIEINRNIVQCSSWYLRFRWHAQIPANSAVLRNLDCQPFDVSPRRKIVPRLQGFPCRGLPSNCLIGGASFIWWTIKFPSREITETRRTAKGSGRAPFGELANQGDSPLLANWFTLSRTCTRRTYIRRYLNWHRDTLHECTKVLLHRFLRNVYRLLGSSRFCRYALPIG